MNTGSAKVQKMASEFVGRFADQRLSHAMAAAQPTVSGPGASSSDSSGELLHRIQGTPYALSRFITDI